MRQFLADPERMGRITAVAMQMHRNTPPDKPQWSRPALLTPDVNARNVAWEEFLGEAPARALRSAPLHPLALLLGHFRRQRF